MFETAYFWRIDPGVVLALPLKQFELYEQQGMRIAEQLKEDDGG
jgi:hypothetical protein